MPLKMLADRTGQFLAERAASIFGRVTETFFELADGMTDADQQTQYYDAIKMLRAGKANFTERWLNGVSAAFGDLPQLAAWEEGGHGREINPASLSSLGDDDVEEIVFFDRMVSAANAKNHDELHLLERRISKVLNSKIAFQQLPLSPEFITEQFAAALRTCGLASQPKLSMLALYEQTVLDQLPELLSPCNRLLEDLGILAEPESEIANDDEKSSPTPNNEDVSPDIKPDNFVANILRQAEKQYQSSFDAIAKEASTNTPLEAPVGSRQAGRKQRVGHHHSSRLIANLKSSVVAQGLNAQGDADSAAINEKRLSCEELLDRLKTDASDEAIPADHYDSEIGDDLNGTTPRRTTMGVRSQVENLLLSRGEQFSDLGDLDQTVIILVDKLFSQASKQQWSQENLLPLLSRIELPTAKLALADQSFFDLDQHPVRRLLNEVAVVANTLSAVEALEKDPLYKKLDEIMARLEHAETDQVELSELLSDLIKFTEHDRRRIGVLEQHAMDDEMASEKINTARNNVDELLGSRLIGHQFGYALVNFAEKAWGSVLFRASLKYGLASDQWLRAVHLLDQLLGLESMPEIEDEFLERLMSALDDSLTNIAFDSYESQRMFASIRKYLLEDKNKAENAHPVIFDKLEAEQVGDYSLRVRVEHVDADIPGEEDVADKGLLGMVDDNLLAEIDSLKKGTWVELTDDSDKPSQRCRLIGKIEATEQYVFGDRHGRKIVVASRNRLAVKMKQGEINVLDNSHLFDDALSQVIRDARRAG